MHLDPLGSIDLKAKTGFLLTHWVDVVLLPYGFRLQSQGTIQSLFLGDQLRSDQ